MRTMEVGKLNKRVTFLKLGDIKDDMRQTTKGLVPYKTVWASLYPIRGNELHEIQKVQGKTTHKCYVRYLEGIDSNCYVNYQGKTYSIESVIDVDLAHKMLEIHCSEFTNKEVMGYVGTNNVDDD